MDHFHLRINNHTLKSIVDLFFNTYKLHSSSFLEILRCKGPGDNDVMFLFDIFSELFLKKKSFTNFLSFGI